MTLAVARNPYATNVPDSLIAAAGRLGVPVRTVDLPSLRAGIAPLGELTVTDEAGPVAATSLAPFLLFGFPAAVTALRVLARTARAQNPVDGVLLADDKAAAAVRLAQAGVAQVRTEICAVRPGAGGRRRGGDRLPGGGQAGPRGAGAVGAPGGGSGGTGRGPRGTRGRGAGRADRAAGGDRVRRGQRARRPHRGRG